MPDRHKVPLRQSVRPEVLHWILPVAIASDSPGGSVGDAEIPAPTTAHIARSEDIVRSHVTGDALTALCGETFVPSRDPEGLPLCRKCQAFLTMLHDIQPEE